MQFFSTEKTKFCQGGAELSEGIHRTELDKLIPYNDRQVSLCIALGNLLQNSKRKNSLYSESISMSKLNM